MPELKYEDLPQIFAKNQEIQHEVNHYVRLYARDHQLRGWNLVEGAKRWVEENYALIQAPIQDNSLGGFIFSRDSSIICYLNTWHPRVYQNFALFHEIYHILTIDQSTQVVHVVEPSLDNDVEERKADYFSSLLLLDAHDTVSFYQTLGQEDFLTRVFLTMSRFQAPYKAVLIRLFELQLITQSELQAHFDQKLDLEKTCKKLGIESTPFERSCFVKLGNLSKQMKNASLPEFAHHSNLGVYDEVVEYFEGQGFLS